jgi:predicted GIY-YIG superfamily endonuclease
VYEHKNHTREGFSDNFNTVRLVYYEQFDDVRNAICREKQLKGWRRGKKDNLISSKNPHWKDLSEAWFQSPPKSLALAPTLERSAFTTGEGETKGPSTPLRSAQGDVIKRNLLK